MLRAIAGDYRYQIRQGKTNLFEMGKGGHPCCGIRHHSYFEGDGVPEDLVDDVAKMITEHQTNTPGKLWELEFIMPKSKGFTNGHFSNLVPALIKCGWKKGPKWKNTNGNILQKLYKYTKV